MRLLIPTIAAAFVFSAATADPAPTMGPARMMGVGLMIIHHRVADYAKWRVAYDADQSNRAAAGLMNCRLRRSIDDANDVVVLCNMSDVAKARSFASSKALAETMAKAGVMGKPQILFLALGH